MKYIVILFFSIAVMVVYIAPVRAAGLSQCRSERNGYCIRLDTSRPAQTQKNLVSSYLFAIPFPGLEFLQTYGIDFCSDIGNTLAGLYRFGVGIAGVSALIMFTWGGIRYLTSAGNPSAVGEGKKRMLNALMGLILIAASFLILYIINPDFTRILSDKTIPPISGNPPTSQVCPGQQTSSQQTPQQNIRAKCSKDDFVGSPSDCINHCGPLGGACNVIPSQQGQAVCPIDGFIGFPADCVPHCGQLGGTCKLIP